ncbi:MAG: protein kinase [Prosthecobacter sp.]|nr:protein kinase [Prosthecobacter sp.]
MDKSTPAAPGKVAAASESALTSHTVNYGTDGDATFDQTIKVKMPGSGMTVFNRYKLERILGRGGRGIVWLADDMKLERPVALKFLPSLIGLDPAAVKELKTETRRGLELSHPHIVRIYDFVDDEDAAAISMEFVDGKTLSELRALTDHGIFTVEQVSKWLPGVCDALDYAHFQRKVVHRDLKPANIMLTAKDEVAKVADFGIARSLSDTMSRLSAAHIGTSGTLPYMSPQQAMGERPLPTDDVYSLGATIYELLAGKPPFYRGDLPTQINSKVPPPMADRRRELELSPLDAIPKEWEDAIAACLNKDPNMRPSCAGLLAEMLNLKASSGTSRTLVFASKTGSAGTAAKSKNKLPLLVAAAVVAVAAGAAVWHFGQTGGKPQPSIVSQTPAPEAAKTTPPPVKKPAAKETPTVAEKPNAPKPAAAPATAAATSPPAETSKSVPTTSPAPAQPAAIPTVATPAPAAMPGSAPMTTSAPPVANPAAPPAGVQPPPVVAATASVASLPAQTPGPPPGPAMSLNPDSPPATLAALPPGVIAPGYTPVMPAQPLVSDPPTGFWTIDQMYPTPPFTTYSAPGKKYLLYRTQATLKEKGLYTSTVDGKEGKSTHNAIQLFQAKSGLKPTGLLDVPTLAALLLSAEPDNIDWVAPYSSSSSSGPRRAPGGGRYNRAEHGDDGSSFLEKTGDKLKGIFGK